MGYGEAQRAIHGEPDDASGPLLEPVLVPLWAAYGAVSAARNKRAPLDLDLPERKLVLDDDGRVTDVIVPERLTAHRLIEEFMIQANVSAAETLEWMTGSLPPAHKDTFTGRTDVQTALEETVVALEEAGKTDRAAVLRKWLRPVGAATTTSGG